jgi:cyclophilin family peptidyl-prolyl cis-trans isomerase
MMHGNLGVSCNAFVLIFGLLIFLTVSAHELSPERIVFQTKLGDLEFALYPKVAPVTTAHILKSAQLGAYNTVNFFRVDRGFVLQCTDIVGNRLLPLDARQEAEAAKKVPLEVRKGAKHDRRGILSMARWDDPNSGGASFSITLGPAPHLDMHYAVFGELTKGWETLDKFEALETKQEGIFVMPKDGPVIVQSTYVYTPGGDDGSCDRQLAALQERFDALEKELHDLRVSQLP